MKDNFKYKDLRLAILLFQKGDFLFSFDLKSGYHHIESLNRHGVFRVLSGSMMAKPSFFWFYCTSFWLSDSLYVFTKLLRPLVKYWRGQGLRAILYLDDGIIVVSDR